MGTIEFDIAEGYGHSYMLQAAQIVLHYAREKEVHANFKKITGAWRHFLAGRDQVALRKLEPSDRVLPKFETKWTPGDFVSICIRPGNVVPACGGKKTWLVLIGDSDADCVIEHEDWLGVIRIAKIVPQNDKNIYNVVSGVCSQFIEHTLPHGDLTLVVGNGDIVRDQKNIAYAASLSQCKIVLFDVYQQYCNGINLGELKSSIAEIVDPCSEKQRLSMYEKCQRVIVDDVLVGDNNVFLTEAIQTGMQAFHVEKKTFELNQKNLPAQSFHDVIQKIDAIVSGQFVEKTKKYQIDHVFVTSYSTFEKVATEHAFGTHIAWVSVGKSERWSETIQQWFENTNYDMILIDISKNALLVSPLFTFLLQKKMRNIAWKMPDIETFENRETVEEIIFDKIQKSERLNIDLMLVGLLGGEEKSCISAIHSVRDKLKNNAKCSELVFQGRKSIWVESVKSFYDADVNAGLIGINVATNSIFGGLYRARKDKFELTRIFQNNSPDLGGRIYFYPEYGETGFAASSTYDFGALEGLLKHKTPDMLLITGYIVFSHLIARQAWSPRNYPIVAFLHSLHVTTFISGLMQDLLSKGYYKGDLFISPSQCGKVVLEKSFDAASEQIERRTGEKLLFPGDIEVIPYGMDLSIYEKQNKIACRQALALPRDRRIILSVGRFAKHQKFDLLPVVIALQLMVEQGCKPYLVLLGSFQEKKSIIDLEHAIEQLNLTEYVKIILNASVEEKKLYYSAADVFVSPSDNVQETYGLTMIEAMAAGLPVVASAWDGYREIVEHEKTGFLVPVTWGKIPNERVLSLMIAEGFLGYTHRDLNETVAIDVIELARYLKLLIDNPELSRKMGHAGRKRAEQNYEIRKQSEKLAEVLLDRIERFSEPKALVPVEQTLFFDDMTRRFAHFSERTLGDNMLIELTASAQDNKWLKTIVQETQLAFVSEERKIFKLVDALQEGPKSIEELASLGVDTLRILRCLKYNIVRICK